MTGHADQLDRERVDWWARQPHVRKPFNMSELREAVFALIDASTLHCTGDTPV